MILGKFYPPHRGHLSLISYARERTHKLTVIIGSLKRETIPGELRFRWLRELCPGVEVLHLTDENPQEPHEHPDFWNIWTRSIRGIYPRGPEVLFSSEHYGDRLAQCLGARHVMVDQDRNTVPVSATMIRNDPYGNWEYLPPPVKGYYAKRVVIVGAESTGKTTLAEMLARHFNTAWVPEFARGYIDKNYASLDDITAGDFPVFARGQQESEDLLAREANRVLICDTDARTTAYFSEIFTGRRDQAVMDMALSRRYDLYLLTGNDFPWVGEMQRKHEHLRERFFSWWKKDLDDMGANYLVLGGSMDERFRRAVEAVEGLFTP